ncbi:MAG: TonB-dependent receptor [Bacteroidia bacterium]
MRKNYLLNAKGLTWAILGGVMLLPMLLFSQATKIQGRVVNRTTQKALEGVTLAIPEFETGANTDAGGNYVIEFDRNGKTTANLHVELSAYTSQDREITLDKPEITLNIELMEELTTDAVVISSTKGAVDQKQSNLVSSVSVVKPRSIDMQATTSVEKVITQIPGVDNLDGQISIRGSSGFAYGVGARVMVLMDGLPLISGDGGYPEMSLIPVDNISQIEVLKGASSVLYGSGAMGGVINVLTGDAGEKPRTSIRFRQGFYDRPNNKLLDWDGKKAAYNTSLHVFHQRRIGSLGITAQADLIKDSGYRQGTDKEEGRFILLTRWQPKKIVGLSAGVNISFRSDSSGSAIFWNRYLPKTDTLTNSQGKDSLVNVGGGLTPNTGAGVYRKQLNTRLAVDPYIKYLTANGQLFWYRGRFLKNDNVNNSGQAAYSSVFYNDFLYKRSLMDKVDAKINWQSGLTVALGQTNSPELYNGNYKQTSTGLYTQVDGLFMGSRLNVSAGARFENVKTDILSIAQKDSTLEKKGVYDRNSAVIETANRRPIFRLGVNYEVARGTNVRASFGQAFRVPTIAEYFAKVGAGGVKVTPSLEQDSASTVVRPESGYSAEIGFRQAYAAGTEAGKNKFLGYVDVAFFQMRYSNMMEFGVNKLDFLTASAYFSTRNVAEARIRGFEVTTINSFNLGKVGLNLSGGVTYLNPKNLNAVPDSQQLDLSYYNPGDGANANLGQLVVDINFRKLVDNPKLLKYRTNWLVRATAGATYGNFGVTTNYRYRSFMTNIDQYLYFAVPDIKMFRDKHPSGEHILDLIFSYDIPHEKYKQVLSLTIDNIGNVEYFVIPGTIAEQRKFTLQYQVKF